MKRFHVHLGVADLDQSIRFYSGLFGAPPTVRKDDYAKWMIEDPRVNFAISTRSGELGVNHLGLQAESADELAGIREQFTAADKASLQDEPGASCCYARSDKHWVTDPQGIAWEGYHTLGEVRYFDSDQPMNRRVNVLHAGAPQNLRPALAPRTMTVRAGASEIALEGDGTLLRVIFSISLRSCPIPATTLARSMSCFFAQVTPRAASWRSPSCGRSAPDASAPSVRAPIRRAG